MKKNSTLQQKPLATFNPGRKTEKIKKLTQQSGSKNKSENHNLDGVALFSQFTADIIKKQAVWTR